MQKNKTPERLVKAAPVSSMFITVPFRKGLGFI